MVDSIIRIPTHGEKNDIEKRNRVGTNSKRHQNVDENVSKHQSRKRTAENGSMVLCQSRQAQDTSRYIKILYIMAIQSKTRTDHPQHPQHITSRRSHRYELGMNDHFLKYVVDHYCSEAPECLHCEILRLREAHQITLDWLMSDTVFTDYGQLEYHRNIIEAALESRE
jgi:hypothetical protein